MSVFIELSVLALRPLTGIAINMAGLGVGEEAAGAVTSWLGERFTNHGDKVVRALRHANERAWRTLEMSLGGDTLFGKLGQMFQRADQKAMADEVRRFLDESGPKLEQGQGADLRKRCLAELAAARKGGLLEDQGVDLKALATAAGRLAKFSRPEDLLAGDLQALGQVRQSLPEQNFPSLRRLLELAGDRDGTPLLAEAARYFFRRQVETDDELFRGLSFSMAQASGAAQMRGFETLEIALEEWGSQIQQALDGIAGRVEEIHENVLDIQAAMRQQQGLGEKAYELLKEINYRQQRLGMHGELKAGDSLSIRTDTEKQAVKALLGRFRALPPDQQQRLPAALNGLGKLLVGAGEFPQARAVFEEVADQVDSNTTASAEAHYNAYRAALEQRKWDEALPALQEVVRLDAARFAPFPAEKYRIRRIMGAGGFGVAFLCHDVYLNEDVVLKSLYADDLDRGIEALFAEVQVLRRLHHPNIICATECDFADRARQQRPYFVMEYFDGQSLQTWLDQNGTMELKDLLAIAIPTAEALAAAHSQNILHRDIKPDNLLVSTSSGQWQTKLIDFGLALRQQAMRNSMTGSGLGQSVQGSSVAGTLEYAPPEQMGRLAAKPGPYSDIYSFGKLCSRALLGTTDPRSRHLATVPQPLAQLLEDCLEQEPQERPDNFSAVLEVLRRDGCTATKTEIRPTPKPVAAVSAAKPKQMPAAPTMQPIQRAAPKPGDVWTNSIGIKFAHIPAGEFLMGSPADEKGRFPNETPHRVRITNPFMLGTFPVSQAQWRAVMGNDPSIFKGDDLPVEQVSWDDAAAFCEKLGQRDGKKYHLPTEAEWEYACRAGTKTAYYTGGDESALAAAGWYRDNSGRTTHPVGQKKPNLWGLYDMHGNVWEWCSDWYAEYPARHAVDPTGAENGSSRVWRGGSWRYGPRLCRAAYRYGLGPAYRGYDIGFRLALDFH